MCAYSGHMMNRTAVAAALVCVLAASAVIAGVDVKVNQDVGPLLQNETSITINFGWPGNLVVGYNENPGPGTGLGISYSLDNGINWNDSQTQGFWGVEADPAVASDLLGNVFAAMISYAPSGGTFFPNNGIYVSRSGDGGATWMSPVMVDQFTNAPGLVYFCDKEYITVDTAPSSPFANRLYVAWQRDHVDGIHSDIYFAWSADQATTFNYTAGPPVGRISDMAILPGGPTSVGNGPVPATSPTGDVYVAWQDAPLGIQSLGRIFVDKSTDGGVTFGTDAVAATYNTCARYPKGGQSFQVRSFPSIAVSPQVNHLGTHDVYVAYAEDTDRVGEMSIESDTPGASISYLAQVACWNNNVYAVWVDQRHGPGTGEIYFNRSTDNGATWGTDVRLSTGVPAGTAFAHEPRVAADQAGVFVVWEDSRNGLTDIYYNLSLDSGANWMPLSMRLDTGDLPGAASSRSPEMVASGGNVYVVWADDRNGTSDVYSNSSNDGGMTWKPAAIRVDHPLVSAWAGGPQVSAFGANVFVTWADGRNGVDDIFYNFSTDGGATWLSADARLDTGTGNSGNPVICSSGTNVYVAWWDMKNGLPDVYFNRSNNNGLSWQISDVRLDSGSPAGAVSSSMIDIACTGSYVHVAWADDRSGLPDIYYTVSSNNGITWPLNAVRIDSDFFPGRWGSFDPQLSVQPGAVYLSWEDDRYGAPDIFFRYSLDNGTTWYQREFHLDAGDLAGASSSHMARIASTGSFVYAVWEDTRNGLPDIYFSASLNNGVSWNDGPDDGDIMLVRSDDGGLTWTPPVQVNDDTGPSGQFQPWIDVKPNGVIDVVWLDRRGDVVNDSWLQVYMGTSSDRGVTFANNPVSDVPFGPPPPPTVWPWPWMGEYIGVDVDDSHAYIVWTDTRTNDRDIWFDRFPNPSTTGAAERPPEPESHYLDQNVPNPFNPVTTISYGVVADGAVTLAVYDVSGKLVRVLVDGWRPAGHHEAVWDSRDGRGNAVASGVYFYRLETGDYAETRKMVLLK